VARLKVQALVVLVKDSLKAELALPEKSISLVKKFCFVAERRVNLAGPFKAGEAELRQDTSRQRRVSECFSRR
jgi:hypothetical protein